MIISEIFYSVMSDNTDENPDLPMDFQKEI